MTLITFKITFEKSITIIAFRITFKRISITFKKVLILKEVFLFELLSKEVLLLKLH